MIFKSCLYRLLYNMMVYYYYFRIYCMMYYVQSLTISFSTKTKRIAKCKVVLGFISFILGFFEFNGEKSEIRNSMLLMIGYYERGFMFEKLK